LQHIEIDTYTATCKPRSDTKTHHDPDILERGEGGPLRYLPASRRGEGGPLRCLPASLDLLHYHTQPKWYLVIVSYFQARTHHDLVHYILRYPEIQERGVLPVTLGQHQSRVHSNIHYSMSGCGIYKQSRQKYWQTLNHYINHFIFVALNL
jgi:hypothetical protein